MTIKDHIENIKRIRVELAEYAKGPITKEFLVGIGFNVQVEYPLYTAFQHSRYGKIYCSIGKYGEFSLVEYHWCNEGDEVRAFKTINAKLTINDFYTILKLSRIELPEAQASVATPAQ